MTTETILHIDGLAKTFDTGLEAVQPVDLKVGKGEIFALLGPNGAGKTTLIGMICGTVRPTAGAASVMGFDVVRQYRRARAQIGFVPQELHTDAFESVWAALRFSRGLFGRPRNDALLEQILKDLSLWDKRDAKIMTLSGGMKRRVLIAKALAHEPQLLFLDEPTAGVDVEMRQDMWSMVERLRDTGVTVVLTTHYIQEAEQMADRIGVIHHGRLLLVDDKNALMSKLGERRLTIQLKTPMVDMPAALTKWDFTMSEDKQAMTYSFGSEAATHAIDEVLRAVLQANIQIADLVSRQSSLEEIFVNIVKEQS